MARKAVKRPPAERIEKFLTDLIQAKRLDLVAQGSKVFGISRQAVNGHLRNMVKRGLIEAAGTTRSRRYKLIRQIQEKKYELTPRLEEHEVWESFIAPLLHEVRDTVRRICQYGFTEMLNNAIDHSGGTSVTVSVERSSDDIVLRVSDNGVGIFRKLRDSLGLEDEQHAVFELSKGKLTTDPQRHTGEGIFFSSRAFDRFSILSGGLFFTHSQFSDRDWLLETGETAPGTVVRMEISLKSERILKQLFDSFGSDEHPFSFAVTHVPVALAQVGADNLVSRSQARRLVTRLDLFDAVVLDFGGVPELGQAFADEIFRVFANAHPNVNLQWMGANPDVEAMIQRAVAERTRTGSA